MKRVIVSGGGTGGHIYPAITIIKEIEKLGPTEFLYVGSKNGLESDIVPKENIPFATLEVHGFARKLTVQNLITLFQSIGAIIKATSLIRNFKPDVVIGTGGYVCGPIVLAASLMGVPTLIQEQNVIAGVTNKILGRFVDVVALGYDEARKFFSHSKKVVYTGNPVRPAVVEATRKEGRNYFGLMAEEFAVLIAGGSRGAQSINSAMIDVHKYFANKENIKLIHVTGSKEFHRICNALGRTTSDITPVTYGKNSLLLPYMYDMPMALGAADLAVFRAGAIGLAELTVRGIPSILVPYPYAAEDHQTYNAQNLVKQGAARIIRDRELTSAKLIEAIEELRTKGDILSEMAKHSLEMGMPNAAKDIAKLVFQLAEKK